MGTHEGIKMWNFGVGHDGIVFWFCSFPHPPKQSYNKNVNIIFFITFLFNTPFIIE